MAKKPETPKTFTTLTKIRHDGDYYAKGDAIELTQEQAQPLLERGAVKPFLAPAASAEAVPPTTPPVIDPPVPPTTPPSE